MSIRIEPIFWAFVGMAIGALVFWSGFKSWHIKRLIENTPTCKIRGMAMGFVEISGKISKPFEEYIKSPFSNKDCVWYKYLIEQFHRDRHGGRWVPVRSGEKSVLSYLSDGTGEVLVDPAYAEIDIPNSEITTNIFSSIPKQIQEFSKQINLSLTGFFSNRSLRFCEWVLLPEKRVYIIGNAKDNPHKEEASSLQGFEDVLIGKGKMPFYISDKDEKGVVKVFTKRIWLGFIVGAVIFTSSSVFMFAAFS